MRLCDIPGRLAKHTGLRHLLFLVAALFSILLIGYHFGTFDQVIHLPFLKAEADSALYPGDTFIALRNPPNSYFWYLLIPFYRWGILEVTLFLVHFLATYLTFWGIWSLSLTLFRDSLTSTLAVLTFIFPHFGFLGFPVIEFSLLNRTFVLPFLLFTTSLYLQKHYRRAFFMLGLATNLHALSAGMVFVMLLFASLVEVKRIGITRLIQAVLFSLIGAVPIILLMAGSGREIDWSLRPAWLSVIARGILYQVFYPFSTIPYIILLTISGFSAIGMFFIAGGSHPLTYPARIIKLMFIAASLIFGLGIFTALFLPVTVLIELQLNRVSIFFLIFAYLIFANHLVKEYRIRHVNTPQVVLLVGTFIVSAVPIVPLAVWGILRWLNPRRINWGWAITGIAGPFIIYIAIALKLDIWSPGINIFALPTTWVDAQEWARDNTPLDSVFITPPEKGDIYEPDWRVFSERPSVVSVIELLEIALAPEYLDTWQDRFQTLAPGALAQFNGIYFQSDVFASQAFYNLSDQALMDAANKYDAAYLVVEKPHTRDFSIVYENRDYIIYSFP